MNRPPKPARGAHINPHTPARTARGRRLWTADDRQAYLLIAPFFIFFALFVLYPAVYNVLISLTNYDFSPQYRFVGLRNYQRLVSDEIFLQSLRNTLVYALFSVLPLMAAGFIAAVAVNRRMRGMALVRTLLMYPYVTSMVAVSMVWLYMLDPTGGFVNKALLALGLRPLNWLLDKRLALPSLIFINIWKNTGYVMILFLAGLQNIPCQLYEAARVDGAGDWVTLRHITIPQVRPITFFVLITMTIESFKTFEQVRIMTNGGPLNSTTTLVHQIYMRGISESRLGYASAMAVVLLVIVFLVTMLNLRFFRRDGGEEQGGRRRD